MVEEKVKRDEWRDTVTSQGAEETHELFVAPQHTNEENMKYETTKWTGNSKWKEESSGKKQPWKYTINSPRRAVAIFDVEQ